MGLDSMEAKGRLLHRFRWQRGSTAEEYRTTPAVPIGGNQTFLKETSSSSVFTSEVARRLKFGDNSGRRFRWHFPSRTHAPKLSKVDACAISWRRPDRMVRVKWSMNQLASEAWLFRWVHSFR